MNYILYTTFIYHIIVISRTRTSATAPSSHCLLELYLSLFFKRQLNVVFLHLLSLNLQFGKRNIRLRCLDSLKE